MEIKCRGSDKALEDTVSLITDKKWSVNGTVIKVEGNKHTSTVCYTCGLYPLGFPELIMIGVDLHAGHIILNMAGDVMRKKGEAYSHGDVCTELASHPTAFIDVERDELMGMCHRLFNPGFPALQLVMSDRESRFPWEVGFDEVRMQGQVLLGKYVEEVYE